MSNDFVCPVCGLDYSTISPPDATVAIRSYPRRYRGALGPFLDDEAEEALVRRRSDPTTWSALEYTAHVADVFDFLATSIRRMHAETAPAIDEPGFEAKVAAERHNESDPASVLDRLEAAAVRLADEVAGIGHDGWHRTATFAFGERDILTMTRNAVHEGSHHLRDVERVLDLARRLR